MMQGEQMASLNRFWDAGNGRPVTKRMLLDDREMEVPLVTLLPHNTLALDDVEVSFNAKVADVAEAVSADIANAATLSHADLQMILDGIHPKDSDTMHFTLRFKATQTPEALSRILEQYYKQL
jgi:hypothetical protein